ncbi:MAG: tRNA (adenosine(37)-N6)-threonylcarbamoyltransferase complex dimerization subunit type 1 TsaB [Phycisphaeraceae bacterium]
MDEDQLYSLAIETSGRAGSVSLGRGDALLGTEQVGQRRHAVGLMPAIERLCEAHHVAREQLAEVYVSVGPGSFTGLRIGITTAKVLGWSLGCKLVAVETLQVVAANAPAEAERVAVCLNAKAGRYFAGLFERDEAGHLQSLAEPRLLTMAEVLAEAGRPVVVVGDRLEKVEAEGVTYLEGEAAEARSEVVWGLGREAARQGRFVEAMALKPRYVRMPEAEEVWRHRQAEV